ncbi:MAG: HAD family hydrolase, partial [Holdemanella sp.]|nr:HAD family hydrolase [Holdemanella sp.]
MIKTIFFDLDGTLLPMDQEIFIKAYFSEMGKYMMKYGYDPQQLAKAIWKGTYVMYANDGKITNEEAFWNVMISIYGKKVLEDIPYFDQFYIDKFDEVKISCGYNPVSKKVIDALKDKYPLILATNPIFPGMATEKRISWAGLDVNDFKYVTTYEKCTSSKPNLLYYKQLLEKFD